MTRSRQHGNYEHSDHLTMEQLSAYLDKQLTPAEQASVDAHLHACEQCRLALADLRTTVGLVRAMPQPTLPRSFALPANITPLPIQPAREERQLHRSARRQPPARNGLRRAVRFASSIAAVLGLLFILSGLLSGVSPGHSTSGAASESSAPAAAPAQGARRTPAVSSQAATPGTFGTHVARPTQTEQKDQSASTVSGGTPVPLSGTPTRSSAQGTSNPPQGQLPAPGALPPFLDLSTIEGRLSLGLALVALGIIGLFLTRRRYTRAGY